MSVPERYRLAAVPDDRPGTKVFTFNSHGSQWRVTQIARGGIDKDERTLFTSITAHPLWPTHNILALDGIVSPAALIDILDRMFTTAAMAHAEGSAERAAEIRKALGLK